MTYIYRITDKQCVRYARDYLWSFCHSAKFIVNKNTIIFT